VETRTQRRVDDRPIEPQTRPRAPASRRSPSSAACA